MEEIQRNLERWRRDREIELRIARNKLKENPNDMLYLRVPDVEESIAKKINQFSSKLDGKKNYMLEINGNKNN